MKRSSALPWLHRNSHTALRVPPICGEEPVTDRREADRPVVAPAALALLALAALLCDAPALHAQGIMRTPNLNIAPRIPTISSGAASRVNPNIAGSVGRDGPHIGVRV